MTKCRKGIPMKKAAAILLLLLCLLPLTCLALEKPD